MEDDRCALSLAICVHIDVLAKLCPRRQRHALQADQHRLHPVHGVGHLASALAAGIDASGQKPVRVPGPT